MKHLRAMGLLLTLAATVSCQGIEHNFYDPAKSNLVDPAAGLERSDYRNMLNAEKNARKSNEPPTPDMVDPITGEVFKTSVKTAAPSGEPPIPDVAAIIATPKPPKLGQTKLVSVAVTDDVPLKDVLLELARLADVDIEVDAGITGGVAFRAKDKPFNEVIERLADLAGLRYTMKNNVLRVERDTPYIEVYTLDFLNTDRSTTNSISISTSVLSTGVSGGTGSGGSGGSSGGGGLNSGSQSAISAKTDSDFWQKFDAGVQQIVNYEPQSRLSLLNGVSDTPRSAPGNPSGGGATVQEVLAGAPAPVPPPASATPAAAQATANSSGAAGGTGTAANGKSFYTINRQAGTLTVSATERQHHLIREFIRKMTINASAQVLIEAKIVEVTLNEAYQAGINWSALGSNANGLTSSFGAISSPSNIATINFTKNNLTGLNIDLNAVVKLADQFGTTRTLSSPRLHAINNQQAVLTFAKNQVYFTIKVEKNQQSNNTTLDTGFTVDSTINTVPIGIIMTILPSINAETGDITLNVRPTLSRVVDQIQDPGLALALQLTAGGSNLNVQNLIPVVEVRELDSILKVHSGDVMVIGGLMQNQNTNTDNQLPGLGSIPIVGNLFKNIDKQNAASELVIFIRATMIGDTTNVHKADENLYKKFTIDPRPITF